MACRYCSRPRPETSLIHRLDCANRCAQPHRAGEPDPTAPLHQGAGFCAVRHGAPAISGPRSAGPANQAAAVVLVLVVAVAVPVLAGDSWAVPVSLAAGVSPPEPVAFESRAAADALLDLRESVA